MFERRLKFVLAILFIGTIVLLVRAFHLQVINRARWTEEAADTLRREQSIETTRGMVRDFKGVPVALDVACVDACVDYRAITNPPDPDFVNRIALQWARERRADEWRAADGARRKLILAEERKHVAERIDVMWATLAHVAGRPLEEIEDARHQTMRRVEMRRRYVWYRKYELARREHEARNAHDKEDPSLSGWWKQWLIDETQDAPQLDQFDVKVAEQTEAHPILRAISSDVQNRLGKDIDDYPGLVLKPGMTRSYPWGEAACHVIGHLTRVDPRDLAADPFADDELRKYQYNDLIGRNGIEGLCEPLLRGTRGRVERYLGSDRSIDNRAIRSVEPRAGEEVKTTIDIGLQQEVLDLFQHAELKFEDDSMRHQPMHGGAVLIDIPTGEVRALVSAPTFDPNTFDENYALLARDNLNKPLLNRATQNPLETGSIVKPVVGLGGITQGVIGVNEGIECTGYPVFGGRKLSVLRCWTASKFAQLMPDMVGHHQVPRPHQGHDGNRDGFLTFSDALERSCNVYFENVANRLGLAGLSYWMEQFGLGQPTGIGIAESRGRLPSSYDGNNVKYATWSAGIGQGPVAATPLQMANVAATIARDGVWMRPTLIARDTSDRVRPIAQLQAARLQAATTQPTTQQATTQQATTQQATTQQATTQQATTQQATTALTGWWTVPDRRDLHLSPAGLTAAHLGMFNVVNGESGTGRNLRLKGDVLLVAGKTGTAQAARFTEPDLDENGVQRRDDAGRPLRRILEPSTVDRINPRAPWYVAYDLEGKNLKHSWIIGYAPAQHPRVAFAVMVEYGGSGGIGAAGIARGMLDACIQHGYLLPDDRATTSVKLESSDGAR
jgi:penicillin-binding protein 2